MFKKQHHQAQHQPPPPMQAPGVYLPPPPYQMGVLSEFAVHQQPIVLRIREVVSWSGDDFAIKDAVSGFPIFRIDAKMFSVRQKKTLVDYNGRPLFEFKRKMFKLLAQYVGYRCGDENAILFNIEKTGIINPKLHITFNNLSTDGRPEHWTLKGKWYSGHSQIMNTDGVIVADINRDYANLRQIFGMQTYEVTIAPGVDASLVTAICVCLDEAYNEDRDNRTVFY